MWEQAKSPQNIPAGLYDVLTAQAQQHPEAMAITALQRRPLNYGRLHRQVHDIGETLGALGIGRSDRVALLLPNGPEMACAFLAVAARAACVPLNPLYRYDEYTRYFAQLRPTAVLVQADLDSPARAVARASGIPLLELTLRREAEAGIFSLTGARPSPSTPGEWAHPHDVALILPTSGTTAQPKLVPLTHANLLASAYTMAASLALRPQDRCLNIMPLFHIHGLVGALLASLVSGASVVCTPGFHAPSFLAWLKTSHPTWYTAVPTMHQAILTRVQQATEMVSEQPLRFIRSCSAPLPLPVLAGLEQVFQVPVIEAYGMTEAAHQISSNPLPPQDRKPGSVGVATGLEVAIIDAAGQQLPSGETGEIIIRGGNVTPGYVDNPDANAAAFVHGWLRTGDVGVVDAAGYLFITGRQKEMINRGGEKIAPREIEEVLLRHPAVAETVAFALPHPQLGEEVAAAVVVCPGMAVSAQALHAFAATYLAEFKIPRQIVFVEELPQGPTGKLQRLGLADVLGLTGAETVARPPAVARAAPRTPLEEQLATLWTEVVDSAQVGIHDDFFQSGGDSLLATQLLARLRQKLHVEVPFYVFFATPTIAGLAQHIAAEEQTAQRQPVPPLVPVGRQTDFPVAFAQERSWFFAQVEPANPAYNRPVALRLSGPLEVLTLECGLNDIIRRHAALRTVFPTADGQPRQRIVPTLTITLPVLDLQDPPASMRQSAAQRRAALETQRPFDYAQGPLIRATLLRLAPQEHVLLIVIPHIVFDAWSATVLLRELTTLYAAYVTGRAALLPELSLQYADVAVWQRQQRHGAALAPHLAYWQARLAGALTTLDLPTDRPRPTRLTFRSGRQCWQLPAVLAAALKAFSRRQGGTLFMTLLAAWQALLYRYTGQEDVVISTPMTERTHVETEDLIGCFINTLVLWTDLTGAPTFQELLGRVRTVTLEAYAHADLPFGKLIESLRLERHPGLTPFGQVVFNLEHVRQPPGQMADLILEEFPFDPGVSAVELLVEILDAPQGVSCVVTYSADLFDAPTIQRLLGHYQTVLESVVTDPEQSIATVPLLTAAERQQVLVAWNTTQAAYRQDVCVHELFEAQVVRTPEAMAVLYEDDHLTYHELNRRANQLAHYLQTLGVGPEVLVGIGLERSLELMVGVLGILKAGGAYVPLDPSYPPARRAFMIEDAQVTVLLTQEHLRTMLPAHQATVLCLDSPPPAVAQQPEYNPTSGVTVDNLAYVVYTSGSTGRPKGVLGLHRGTLNVLACWWQTYPFAPHEVWGQRASISFVNFLQELFTPLLQGVPTLIIPEAVMADVAGLVGQLARYSVTRLMLVPSLLRVLLDTSPDLGHRLPALRLCSVGGEALAQELVQRFHTAMPHCRLLQGYGMSEASAKAVWCDTREMATSRVLVPIGRPIANAQIYVLDQSLQPVPVGVPGELYVAGAGLARGYLNRAELTAEKFLPHPYSATPGAQLYRTGDLARYLPDGSLEFLGRRDQQVKVRGIRVELGEIAATLGRHPAIRQAIVLAQENAPDDTRLVAYVVTATVPAPTIDTLRRFVQATLPDYMVPAAFVFLDALPLLPNGKIDYQALPAPPPCRPALESAYVAPRTLIEEQLVDIWAAVLGVEQVGIHDHFFALGGHSLQATQVIARARHIFEVDLSVRALFDAPTVAELAVVIAQGYAPSPPPQQLERLLTEVEGMSTEDMRHYFTRESMSEDREEGEV